MVIIVNQIFQPEDWYFYTRLQLPTNVKVISSGDTREDGFFGDGEYWFVAGVDDMTIQKWLYNPPPWGSEWQQGPIPNEIGYHAWFGKGQMGYTCYDNECGYRGNEEVVELLSSTSTLYSTKSRSEIPGILQWHAGNLLIVDQKNKKIWLSVWKW